MSEVTLRCPECRREAQSVAQPYEVPGSVLVLRCPECLPSGAFQEEPDEVIEPPLEGSAREAPRT